MSEKKHINEDGYQPKEGQYGYQPKYQPLEKGYQPVNQISKPAPPPKKP
ncbi:hypothetical protein [Siccibacter turicensis]|nr:hypothetical protein [Siccibacter turicensis]MDY0972599.1 hypothetical protein [Siccibacter turicensis]